MRRRILTIGGTGVYLHLGTLLFLLYALLTGTLPMMLTALLSVMVHECAHAGVAACMGQPPQEIEVTPLGAVMRLEDEERLPSLRRAMMLLAGPAATLLLCVFAYLLTRSGMLPVPAGRRIFLSNAAILLVNLLPVLPLDGGRLVTLLLTALMPGTAARRVMRIMGVVCGTGMIAAGVWLSWHTGGLNLSLACAGCFVLYATSSAMTTQAMAELRALMDRKIRLESSGCLPCRLIAVTDRFPVRRALQLTPQGKMAAFLVMQMGTQHCLGLLTEQQAVAAMLDGKAATCAEALKIGKNQARLFKE